MEKIRQISYNKELYLKLLKHGFTRLYFGHGLDRDFAAFYNLKYKKVMIISVLIGMIIFALSGLLDNFFAPNAYLLQIIRFAIILPLIFIIYLCMVSTQRFDHYLQYCLMTIILITAIGVITIGLLQPNPMRDMYFNSMLLILMFTFILSKLQFWKALFTSIILYLMLMIGLYFDNSTTSYAYFGHSFVFLAGVLILGVSSYALEKSIRINYLQTLLLNIEQQELKDAKNHLEKLSNIDGLTGISNHRHFHELLKISWNHCLRKQELLALLIIDVDYFKQYNDLYGHQAGDECLKLVANAIKKSVRRSTDLTARYGGDEFVVLINDVDLDSLKKVIDIVRKNIAKLNLKHEFNKYEVVTVSIGAILTIPERKNSPNDFIAVADYALYQAKNEGRNKSVIIKSSDIPNNDLLLLRRKLSAIETRKP